MHFHALACDYDGTLAHDGTVSSATVEQLFRLKRSGRKLILVTGRHLDDLLTKFPQATMFDGMVVENGALLYNPSAQSERLLATAPSAEFVRELQKKKVPLALGKVIVATSRTHEAAVRQTINELNLQLQTILNKASLMVLPAGIDKASGLKIALSELGLAAHQVVAVGDAENDLAMFSLCGCAVAVSNALPSVKQNADLVTNADHAEGVCELIDLWLQDEQKLVSAR